METAGIGIIGTGSIALRRAAQFAENPNSEVVAVASRTMASAEEAADEFGACAYDSWLEMLADQAVEAVAIATPNTKHYEQAHAALESGKHVCVEYPLCQTLEEARALRKILKAQNRQGYVPLREMSEWDWVSEEVSEGVGLTFKVKLNEGCAKMHDIRSEALSEPDSLTHHDNVPGRPA